MELFGDSIHESFWQYKPETFMPRGLDARQVETKFYDLLSLSLCITCAFSVSILLNIMVNYRANLWSLL